MARLVVLILSVLVCACGGSGSSGSTPTGPANPNMVTITASGTDPKVLTVAPGTRVLFLNSDTRRHDMTSDPHPDHTDCPEINSVGVLNPGQSRETGNLVAVRTCGFHDHDNPDNTSLKGQVVIR